VHGQLCYFVVEYFSPPDFLHLCVCFILFIFHYYFYKQIYLKSAFAFASKFIQNVYMLIQ